MRRRIGEILIDAGILAESALQDALSVARMRNARLGTTLIQLGFVTDQQLAAALAEHLDLPHLGEALLEVDEKAARRMPYGYLQAHACAPVRSAARGPVLAMSDPLDFRTLDFVRETTGIRWEPVVAAESAIIDSLNACLGRTDRMEALVSQLGTRDDFTIVETHEETNVAGDSTWEDAAPAVQIVSTLIANGIDAGASDIHIEPTPQHLDVRYRVDGKLRESVHLPATVQAPVVSRIKIMAEMDIAEKRQPQDGHIRARFGDRAVDLRVSTLPTSFGEKVVLRILDRDAGHSSLEECGFRPADVERLTDALDRPQGTVLVTGPTGSGKSTTLYASLLYLHDVTRNIVTIEDPIERFIAGINQVQLNEAAGLTFASGLRSILRQDPDVVMVGEIRDPETAEIAMRASLTGHLVLSTLHTNDVPSTITRMKDLDIDSYLVASSLVLVMAQRLIRANCRACRTEYAPTPTILRRGGQETGLSAPGPFLRGVGCDACGRTGYSGRTVVYEMMPISDMVRQLIASSAREDQIRAQARLEGMGSMFEMGVELALEGETTLEEVVYSIPPPQGVSADAGAGAGAPYPESQPAGWSAVRVHPSWTDQSEGMVLLVPKALSEQILQRLDAGPGAPSRTAASDARDQRQADLPFEEPIDIGLEELVEEIQGARRPSWRAPTIVDASALNGARAPSPNGASQLPADVGLAESGAAGASIVHLDLAHTGAQPVESPPEPEPAPESGTEDPPESVGEDGPTRESGEAEEDPCEPRTPPRVNLMRQSGLPSADRWDGVP